MGEYDKSTSTLSGAGFAPAPTGAALSGTAHVRGIASSISHTTTASLRTRANFAVQHMLAASRFARMVGEIEVAHAGESSGPFFDEIISYASTTILTSAAGLEAYINELFIDADTNFPEYRQGASTDLWNFLWREFEKKPTLEKYQLALDLKKQPRIPKGEKSSARSNFEAAGVLIAARDALIHFKPQWDDEEKSHRNLANLLLKHAVPPSPFYTSALFPHGFMCHAMAVWSVTTCLQFVEAFSQRAGLDNKFDGFVDQFTTSNNP